jgi:hypothetical protein
MSAADPAMNHDEQRRRNVRRWTIVLVIVVLAFYLGFILSGVLKAG